MARSSGLTVRAPYHYDGIGLVRASERTASGHRRYTDRDLRRLYRVHTLRTLGLPGPTASGPRPPRGRCGGTTAKNSGGTCRGPRTGCANC
nr:MerR family transcriptional regulator [Actinoallomurus iriomotensis]